MTPQEILDKEGIQNYQKDIRFMTSQELRENFGAESSGKPLAALIIKNIIWQTYSWIQSGKIPLFEGNLRSFWYYIKPVLARVNLIEGSDHYQTMLKAFVEFVGDYKIFRYMELGFDDENWENRRIGTTSPQIIVFAEKVGWMKTLKELHKSLGVTVMALGGSPSLLSSEYAVAHIGEITSLKQRFFLVSAVDYDPSGYSIARAFKDQLRKEGILDCELTDLILPSHYTPEEIELFKYLLSTKQETLTQNWLDLTGGINGTHYGLEADSMPRDRFKNLVIETVNSIANFLQP